MSIENVTIEVAPVVGQTAAEALSNAVDTVVGTATEMSHTAATTTAKAGSTLGGMAKSAVGVVANAVKENKTVVIATAAVAGVAVIGTIGYKYFKKKRAQKQADENTTVKASVNVNEDGSVDLGVDLG